MKKKSIDTPFIPPKSSENLRKSSSGMHRVTLHSCYWTYSIPSPTPSPLCSFSPTFGFASKTQRQSLGTGVGDLKHGPVQETRRQLTVSVVGSRHSEHLTKVNALRKCSLIPSFASETRIQWALMGTIGKQISRRKEKALNGFGVLYRHCKDNQRLW